MKVLRKQEVETTSIQVGDQIVIPLAELGEFTATAHKVTDEGVLFIFDDYVASRPMNAKDTNNGGFEKSDLKKWMDTVLFMAFSEWLRNHITNLSVPTVGEIFGHEDDWCEKHFEPDTDEQLPLMKQRKNRVAYLNNEWEWGWLRNAMKKEYSASSFAIVSSYGGAYYSSASNSCGVRPVFTLVKEKSWDHVSQGNRVSYSGRSTKEVTKESLQIEISEKENEIRVLKQEIKNLEEKEMYKKVGLEIKRLKDIFVEAGFTEDEAFHMVLELLKTALGVGGRKQ